MPTTAAKVNGWKVWASTRFVKAVAWNGRAAPLKEALARFVRSPDMISPFRFTLLRWGLLVALIGTGHAQAAPEAAGLEFFEKHVRPVLIESCYSCHSATAEKVKGGLLLDTREGLLKGGDSGPAILAGDPEKSLLIKAIRYANDDLQMPPKGKRLPAHQVEDLVAWVKMGAPDPRTGAASARPSPSAARQHWAFQRVQEPVVPVVKNKKLTQTPVDNFLLAKLEAKGLAFNPRADQRTLLRRATFDLTGLPPTTEELAAFEQDKSPDAFAKVVELTSSALSQ